MTQVHCFTFNAFQENTYIIYDDTNECIIIDPGCYDKVEEETLTDFIRKRGLKPVRLINTHCHLDHIFGNAYVAKTWGLELEIHKGELPVLEWAPRASVMYSIPFGENQPAGKFIEDGDTILFGETELEALLTPGHSPASLSFYCNKGEFVIVGDVLFAGSIGRTDLPGGDYDTLINSIVTRLMPLGDNVKVYSGHGPSTNIGWERKTNPFLVG